MDVVILVILYDFYFVENEMATRVKVGSNRKETLDLLYNITGNAISELKI